MTLRQHIANLSKVKEELLDKEIVIEAKNGLYFEPTIKFQMKDTYPVILDKVHVDKIIVTYN